MMASSKELEVLLWLLRNKNTDNIVHGTLAGIADECGTTRVTVSRLFKKLYREGFLLKERNSMYILVGV